MPVIGEKLAGDARKLGYRHAADQPGHEGGVADDAAGDHGEAGVLGVAVEDAQPVHGGRLRHDP